MIFTNRKGKIRLYDGLDAEGKATPYYLELKFTAGDLSAPLGVPRNDERFVMDRGVMSSVAHFVEESDEKKMAPLEMTFSCMLDDTSRTTYLLNWLHAMNDGRSTTVNSNPLDTTQGDTQRDGTNNNPTFADSNKGTCNVEYLLDGTNDLCWKYNEVYFDLSEQQITESEDSVALALRGKIYGTIPNPVGGSFTSGTDITA